MTGVSELDDWISPVNQDAKKITLELFELTISLMFGPFLNLKSFISPAPSTKLHRSKTVIL